jgi:phage gp45-like
MEDYRTSRNNSHRYIIGKIDDTGDIQTVDGEGLTGEKHTEMMRLYPHGFTSVSPKESHMMVVGLGNKRDQLLALGGEHPKYRHKNVAEGDSVLYNQNGDVIRIFKKQMDITHASNIKLSIGAGITNGAPGKDKDVTVTMDANHIVLTKGSSVVEITGDTINITAATINLVGNVHLGSKGGVLAGMLGSIDTAGDALISDLATKVWVT